MYRKKGSPYWWIAYRDASGKKIECSTGATDRAKAALVESERRGAVWHETQRGITPIANPLFDEVMADYLEAAQRTRKIDRDIYAGRNLAKWFAGRKIRAITPAEMDAYLAARRAAGVSDSTLKREVGVLNAAINWANRKQRLDLPNPAEKLGLTDPEGRVRWLTHEQAELLIQAAGRNIRAPWLVDFIQLALHTGMRSGEMLGLDWARVDWGQNLLYLDVQKNGRRGSVPLNAVARQALIRRARFRAEHCPAAPHVFCDRRGRRIARIHRSFYAACAAADIADFHIHDLRHTTAAWLVQIGTPLLDVSNLLRHASITMTQRYAHLAPTSARNAVARLAGDNSATLPIAEAVEMTTTH